MLKKERFTTVDTAIMALALELAHKAKGSTFPNPAVGAVVTLPSGRIIGQGATGAWGGPHAEVSALAMAGEKARGATLYVTLEPCCHFGRTPPCTNAIIAAGIRRVVVAVTDPNPLVRGKGLARLRKAGIAVDTGLLQREAQAANEDFFFAITRKRAWITLKLALTLDGRIADAYGTSKWITDKPARTVAHELRRCHAAVAVGRATLQEDDPRLTVRHVKGAVPARIVFVSSPGQIPAESYFARHAAAARSIAVIGGAGKRRIEKDRDIEYWYTGKSNRRASLVAFAEMAFVNNLTSVLVEGGQKLGSAFLENGLVNRLYLMYGNKVVGSGTDAVLFSKGLGIGHCLQLQNREVFVAGETTVVTGLVNYPSISP